MSPVVVPRRSLATVPAYQRPPGAALDLSDNTNRWGSPPGALEALRDVQVHAYPEPYADSLKSALASYLGVGAGRITTGCGSDAVLDAALRAFGEPGARVAIPEPTFPMAAAFARANALEPVGVALTEGYQPDPDVVRATGARVVYLCSPNNPLGVSCEAERVVAIARSMDALVIVDEAYAEFAGRSLLPLVETHENILVLRTFSKAFGLAGVRLGYGVGAPAVVEHIERSRGPYQVSAPAIAAGRAALVSDAAWMRERVATAIAARARLVRALRSRGFRPLPSAANFVLVPMRHAAAVADAMQRRGVAVRACSGLRAVSPPLVDTAGDALRITVGPPAEMRAALAALDTALESGCA